MLLIRISKKGNVQKLVIFKSYKLLGLNLMISGKWLNYEDQVEPRVPPTIEECG